ncbi:hypothetical protein H257_10253 [Aphanomyces astaci]|uniref:Uncharacterized protein n=1 Tax=Aphanomyces astaci TaxID=112090 RepID=W4G8X0_APHAT|nr:hypothetical protein H257_10253 [Aphanomyces astaci]ETV75403.1 hypothetical protein H257_10253 [Aphanomyces astaci]|eukprot:XP_009835037.1 hypothetical protein H257_10253 [Aphanomyces astaci]
MEAPQRRHDTKPTRARHRNEYQRHAQKRYRKVRSGERQQLRQLVVELEAAKATAVAAASGRKNRPPCSTGMLSWADIALALQDAAQVSRSDAWELQVQVVNQARLGRAMWTYATNLLAARTCLRQGIIETWQHVSLPRSPPARREGLDWITTQLYHNADAVVAGLGFPATGELFFDIQVAEERDGGHTVTIRHQREVDESWDSVTARYHSFFIASNGFGYDAVETLHDDNDDENDSSVVRSDKVDNTWWTDRRLVYRRRNIGNQVVGDMMQNYVHRQFIDERRSVLVARNILSDDKYQLGSLKRDASGWIVATRLSPEKTLVTECWTVYALRRGDSNASWADEASFYKVNLAGNMDSSINDDDSPTEAQRALLRNAVYRQGQTVLAKRNAFFHGR